MERTKPFLKWAGGKFKLIDAITRQFPNTYHRRYIEPFVGSGAVAINIKDFPTVIVNDANTDLTTVWYVIRMFPHELVRECGFLFSGKFNNSNDYYQLRKEFNSRIGSDVRRAALFIYLNKHGFNGLCRYNRKGEFNVPFGRYKTVNFDATRIRELSKEMAGWLILNQDYTHVLLMAGAGDVVYCDPPYVTEDQVTQGFTAYSKDAFTLKDQEQLALYASKACERGATVIISNHDTVYTRDLYVRYGAELVFMKVQRNISCKGNSRTKASELLAVFRPKQTA